MDARLLLLAAATTLVGGVRGIIAAEPSTALQSRVAPVQRAALPANLFHLDDNAIIIIGGRPIRAGVAKSEIRAQLAQASGPPQLLRAPRRNVKVVPQVTAALGSAAPARVMDGIANGGPPLVRVGRFLPRAPRSARSSSRAMRRRRPVARSTHSPCPSRA